MTASHVRGFALIEALIAALLLSIGVLGIVGLQVSTVGDYRDTKMRQYATLLATDLADRVRANRAGAGAYHTSNIATASDKACASNATSPCSDPVEVAMDDLYHWREQLRVLGFSTDEVTVGIVLGAADEPTLLDVSIGWDARSGETAVRVKTEIL